MDSRAVKANLENASGQSDDNLAIEVKGLAKNYGNLVAVKDLNLAIPKGVVFGFLGPNGAGKTTTIRMLLGLIRQSRGSARILGYDTVHEREKILPLVGAIVENPSFYPYLSGYDNLKVLAGIWGVPFSRIPEVLELVELTPRAKDKVKTYSLGMKQRLGIASALLKNPRVIFLDEPTNGLDPQGTVEVRNLIQQLGQDGRTIFLSSHLLHEVEQVCSEVAIIHKGTLIVHNRVHQLLQEQGSVVIEVTAAEEAARLLREQHGQQVELISPNKLRLQVVREAIPGVVRRLVEAGMDVFSVTPEKASLENYFLSVTGDNHNSPELLEISR